MKVTTVDEHEREIDELKQSFASFQKEVRMEMRSLGDKIAQREKTNWPVLLVGAGLIITLAGGAFFVVKQEVNTKFSPLEASARVSEMDRDKLNAQAGRNSSEIARLEREITVTQSTLKDQLVEVESQFRAVGQMQNMRHATNQQLFGLIWRKVYGEELPLSSFYPDMSRNKSH